MRAVLKAGAGAACLAVAPVIGPVAAQVAPPPGPRPPQAEEEEIVVSGQRPPGMVPGTAEPDLTISGAEVRSYGASSVAEVLSSIAPQTGSARGRGGQPVILLNGRRVASFDEIRNLPAEAIQRVEVYPEDVALQLGYSADQRVVNIVLRSRYKATTAEISGGETGSEAALQGAFQVGHLRLAQRERLQIDGKYAVKGLVTELDRGVAANPSGTDDRDLRSLAPNAQNAEFTFVNRRDFDKTFAGAASATLTLNETAGRAGRDGTTGLALRSEGEGWTGRLSYTLDAGTPNWMMTASATARREESENRIVAAAGLASTSESADTAVDAFVNASGRIAELPAGGLRLNLRASAGKQNFDGSASRLGVVTKTELDRGQFGARASLSLPLASRRRDIGKIGDLSANITGSVTRYSDFGAVTSYGGGLGWSPVPSLRLSAQYDVSDVAPSLRQLGDPAFTTPGVSVFDPARNESVVIALTSGGDAGLAAERRRDLTFNANWAPGFAEGLTVTGSFVRNQTDDAIAAFPGVSAASIAAYPSRFTRNSGGVLTAVDARPVNFAERRSETLRVGFSFGRPFGPRVRPPWGSGPPPWVRPQNAQNPPAEPTPSQTGAPAPAEAGETQSEKRKPSQEERPFLPPPGFYPPQGGFGGQGGGQAGGPGAGGPGGGGGGFFRGGPPQAGRFNVSVFYAARLSDDVVLFDGQPALDLVGAAPLGALLGGGRDRLEFEAGVTWRGAGLRLNGAYASPFTVPGVTPAGDLSYSSATTFNVRGFIGFDSRPELVRLHPVLRGVRLVARADNLLGAAPTVTEASGAVPFALQKGFLAPEGRSFLLGVRKQW